KKVYGDEHPDVALTLSELGSVYSDIGEATKGLAMIEEALRINQKCYETHPAIARALRHLGSTYRNLGDTKKAREHFEASRKMYLQFYDPAHPDIKAVVKNIEELTKATS
ncbi:MAG: tetratricopeptide repeat protein, partial [Parachlamydia sp.]|nr:tetratricopeptide repeat protein [Parachlamydia sp.]